MAVAPRAHGYTDRRTVCTWRHHPPDRRVNSAPCEAIVAVGGRVDAVLGRGAARGRVEPGIVERAELPVPPRVVLEYRPERYA